MTMTGMKTLEGMIYIYPFIKWKSASLNHRITDFPNPSAIAMAYLRPISNKWTTMVLTPTRDMGYGSLSGPTSLSVNFPNREALPDDLRWLNRSIFVQIIGRRKTWYTKHRIGQYLANKLNCEFNRLIIEEVDEVGANYILICPDGVLKQRILTLGALTLEMSIPRVAPIDIRMIG